MNQCLKISIARGGCRFATPLYLGSSYSLSFDGERSDEANRVILIKPRSNNPDDIDGIVVLAESVVGDDGITLALNRNALVEWFKSNRACDVESTVDAHCYVFNEKGDVIADSPVAIEYSPTLFVIDYEDYPLAREVLLQAKSARDDAINAKDSAISAKSDAESAKLKAEKAREEATSARNETQEAKTRAEEAAKTSSMAKEDAITAKDEAQNAKKTAEESAAMVKSSLEKMIASVKKVDGGVEVLLWNGQGDKPVPVFIPHGIDGVTGYVKCDEDGKYYCLKCKKVDGETVLALEQVGIDNADIATGGYVRAVNGATPDNTGNVTIMLVDSAGKLNTARTITLTGGATGSVLFDGSQNVTLEVVVKDNSHKHIITDVDELKSLLDNKLPLTGGTLTGALGFSNNVYIHKKNDTGYLALSAGSDYSGGGAIVLRGKNSTEGVKGGVDISSFDGSKRCSLILNPDGTLTWCGGNIVRSINGNAASKDGDVYIDLDFVKMVESSYAFDTECKIVVISDEAGATFIMQSGTVKDVNITNGATVTFDIPFIDTNYVVVCQQIKSSSTNDAVVNNKSTTGFEIDTSATVDVMWFAFGCPKDY